MASISKRPLYRGGRYIESIVRLSNEGVLGGRYIAVVAVEGLRWILNHVHCKHLISLCLCLSLVFSAIISLTYIRIIKRGIGNKNTQ